MKTLLLSALLLAATIPAFAQGFLIFANNSTNTIFNCVTGLPAPGSAIDQTDTQVGLYIGNVGDSVGSLTLIAQTNCNNPGRFAGGTRTLTGWNPGTVQLQVRAWLASTVYSSYEAAYAGGLGGDGSVLLGVSTPFNFTLVGVGTPPNSTATGGLTPFTIGTPSPFCVPEPSSVALGLVSLLVMVLFHRRK